MPVLQEHGQWQSPSGVRVVFYREHHKETVDGEVHGVWIVRFEHSGAQRIEIPLVGADVVKQTVKAHGAVFDVSAEAGSITVSQRHP